MLALDVVLAAGRSRTHAMGIGGLFFLAGSAPRPVQVQLNVALGLAVVVATAGAAVRPFTPLAFGVLAPVLQLGCSGLWGVRHGHFASTTSRRSGGRTVTEDSDAGAQVLLFTGKGGVGKTTTAAATALVLAERGRRVALTSADPAHSLADALEVPLGSTPVEVAPDCWAQQLDTLERMESSWGEIRSWLVEVMDWAGLSAMEAEELAILPGFEELVALLEIDRLAGCGRYDVVVVDCTPTAESIRLLSLPDLLSWYMDRLFPARAG